MDQHAKASATALSTPATALRAPGPEFGERFWDAVEREIEALDERDLERFLAAAADPIEPRPAFRAGLGAALAALCRARFSN